MDTIGYPEVTVLSLQGKACVASHSVLKAKVYLRLREALKFYATNLRNGLFIGLLQH